MSLQNALILNCTFKRFPDRFHLSGFGQFFIAKKSTFFRQTSDLIQPEEAYRPNISNVTINAKSRQVHLWPVAQLNLSIAIVHLNTQLGTIEL